MTAGLVPGCGLPAPRPVPALPRLRRRADDGDGKALASGIVRLDTAGGFLSNKGETAFELASALAEYPPKTNGFANDATSAIRAGIETGDAGAAYEILPGDTLASLLGLTAAEVVLQGGPDPLSSDLLQFGSAASALSAQQLGLLRFADYGNAAGQISALGVVTPISAIPEPSTYAALAGLAVLGCTWRRRRCTA